MELRIPKALSPADFNAFNQPYIRRLKAWDTHVDGLNPVARTNVAPEVDPYAEPAVFGFSYTVPSDGAANTFVIAGAGELRGQTVEAEGIVNRSDLSPESLLAKATYVLSRMTDRLAGMELGLADVTQSNIYTVHNIHPIMASTVLPTLGSASRHGVRWHFARPPVLEIEFEMDMRGTRREITVST